MIFNTWANVFESKNQLVIATVLQLSIEANSCKENTHVNV
jgi:hypothetical protein